MKVTKIKPPVLAGFAWKVLNVLCWWRWWIETRVFLFVWSDSSLNWPSILMTDVLTMNYSITFNCWFIQMVSCRLSILMTMCWQWITALSFTVCFLRCIIADNPFQWRCADNESQSYLLLFVCSDGSFLTINSNDDVLSVN